MKSIKEKEWCIALENIGPYIDPILGVRYKFLKGERATKEKVFNMIPDMTEEEYARCFRPATEEEINGKFEWDGKQYVLKKEITMTTIDYKQKIKDYMNSSEVDTLYKSMLNNLFPELRESEDERIRKALKEYFINSFQNNGVAAICGVYIKDILAWLKKQGKTSPVLSNSSNIGKVEPQPTKDRYMEGYLNGINDASKTQKSDAWSEEDEERLNSIIESYKDLLRDYKACHDVDYIPYNSDTVIRNVVDDVNFLESLKPQSQWKPSNQQMEVMGYLAKYYAVGIDEPNRSIIISLYEDLQKLMEE